VADDTVEALLSNADRDTVRVVSGDIDDTTVAALRAAFDVRSVDAVDGRVAVEVAATGEDLYALMDRLREADVAIEDIRTVRPNLEEVFLGVTGDGGAVDETDDSGAVDEAGDGVSDRAASSIGQRTDGGGSP
ncbi:MAG: hypothetical protein A07HR67_01272, partial [uncultured archaeon A07HR67]